MNLRFERLNRSQAIEYVSWHYAPPYSIYTIRESDRDYEIECLLRPENKAFAVLRDEEFVGTRTFGKDGRVVGGIYDDCFQDTGGALRPDLTGKGLGERVIRAGLAFGARQFGFMRYRVTIAAFNQRALTVCQRIGFTEHQRFSRPDDGEEFIILLLDFLGVCPKNAH